MTIQETVAEGAASAKELLIRFLEGFTEDNRTRQAEHLPNHVMWCLGHVALILNGTTQQLDGQPLPERDFMAGDKGTPTQFGIETVTLGSRPVDDAERYPSLARGIEIYEAACDRLATAARHAAAQDLERKTEWFGHPIPLHVLITRVLFHTGVHTGQITDLRRALGLERVIPGA